MSDYYTPYINDFMTGTAIDLVNDTIKAVLVDTADYTVDLVNDANLEDIPAGGRLATATLANKSVSGRVFDADNPTFSGVTGDPGEALVLYKDTGDESTSRLIAYVDGLSFTPDGNDIVASWSDGANKVFAH